MEQRRLNEAPYLPQVGCFLLLAALTLTCLMPFLLVDAMRTALEKLHLSPPTATLVILGILFGGFVNVPIHRFERDEDQTVAVDRFHRWMGWVPVQRARTQTILAVNVGGCVIPMLLVLYELAILRGASKQVQLAFIIATAANIAVCYFVAKPIPGLGIAMPAFISPAVAVGVTWLLLAMPQFQMARAPVAFTAGVLGPLIGADLLHLRHFTRISAGVVSIGGAGTFDGIVVSSLMAAFLV